MHPTAYQFASTALPVTVVAGKRVVEAGAYNYNGSVRGVYEAMGPASYVGTDCQRGPGVDRVIAAENLPAKFGAGGADVVIATEMLEHAQDWRAAFTGLVELLAEGGTLLLTTRSPGFPYHPHPGDFHRFTVEHIDAAALACGLEVVHVGGDPDPNSPGVFLLARKPPGWDATGMVEGLAVISPGPPR